MNKIVNLLNRVLGDSGVKLKKQNEFMYWSPFITHHKRKLQVNIQTQKWHCWVSNTGGRNLFQLFKRVNASREQFNELVELVGEPKYSRVKKQDKKDLVRLPDEYKPLWNGGDGIVKRHALTYMYKRGFTDDDILKHNIGYCDEGKYSNRIIIPSYDSDGQLNFFVGRDFYKSKLKYLNSFTSKDVIGFDLFINWDEPIILCEGVFDAMSFKRNAIPLFGKTMSKRLHKKILQQKVKKVFLALDDDAQLDAMKISEKLMNEGIDVRKIDLKNGDPNDIGFKKLTKMLGETEETNFLDLMKYKLYGN
jgi:DNA primase